MGFNNGLIFIKYYALSKKHSIMKNVENHIFKNVKETISNINCNTLCKYIEKI